MGYQIRCTEGSGSTFLVDDVFATRCQAEEIRESWERWCGGGYKYTVEEVPDATEPGSTAARHVEILRKRIAELEAVQKAMSRDLAFALQIGDALREAMRTGEWRAGHDKSMANSAIAGWDRWKPSLAKAPSVPVGASEAPGEGGDSDRRRLEALERWLKVDTYRLVYFASNQLMVALSDSIMDDAAAPTLAALADKLAEKEGKP